MRDPQAREDIERLEDALTEMRQRMDGIEGARQELKAAVNAAVEQRLESITREKAALQEQLQVLALENNALRVDINGLMEASKQTHAHLVGLIGNLQGALSPFSIRDADPKKAAPSPFQPGGRRSINRQQRRQR